MTRSPVEITPLTNERLAKVRIGYTCRHVPLHVLSHLSTGRLLPRSGDLVWARVDRLGQHKGLETLGRRVTLYEGDEIIVAYGNRYASSQFEAEIPRNLQPCHLVAAGGIASMVLNAHQKMMRPTALTPLGLVCDADGKVINLSDWALPEPTSTVRPKLTLALVGTGMDAGKTTVCTQLIRGLCNAGHTVVAAKVTGTGSPLDTSQMRDAGARSVLDFTDIGLSSTYLQDPITIRQGWTRLLRLLGESSPEVAIMELADGLLQRETANLISSSDFRDNVDGVVLAAIDPLGAIEGVRRLRENGLSVLAVSGLLTASPLNTKELRAEIDCPVIDTHSLSDPAVAQLLCIKLHENS